MRGELGTEVFGAAPQDHCGGGDECLGCPGLFLSEVLSLTALGLSLNLVSLQPLDDPSPGVLVQRLSRPAGVDQVVDVAVSQGVAAMRTVPPTHRAWTSWRTQVGLAVTSVLTNERVKKDLLNVGHRFWRNWIGLVPHSLVEVQEVRGVPLSVETLGNLGDVQLLRSKGLPGLYIQLRHTAATIRVQHHVNLTQGLQRLDLLPRGHLPVGNCLTHGGILGRRQ